MFFVSVDSKRGQSLLFSYNCCFLRGAAGCAPALEEHRVSLFLCWEERLGGVQKLDAGSFCRHMETLETALSPAAAFGGQEIWVARRPGPSAQVRLEGNRSLEPT